MSCRGSVTTTQAPTTSRYSTFPTSGRRRRVAVPRPARAHEGVAGGEQPAVPRHAGAPGEDVVPGGLDAVEDAAVERERGRHARARHRVQHADARPALLVDPARPGDLVGQSPPHRRIDLPGGGTPGEPVAVDAGRG